MESEFTDIDIHGPSDANGSVALPKQTGEQNEKPLKPAKKMNNSCMGSVYQISRIRNAMIKGLEDIYYT